MSSNDLGLRARIICRSRKEGGVARIVIAHESISGPDQVYDAYVIGQALAARGHVVLHISDDAGGLSELVGRATGPEIWPLPLPAGTVVGSRSSPRETVGYVDQLVQAGFGDLERLRAATSAWIGQLRRAAPDVIVAIAAPAVWLVGSHVAPVLALGCGAGLPVPADQGSAELSENSRLQSEAVLSNANAVLSEHGLKTIGSLAEILGSCQQWHYGLDLLDPVLPLRLAPSMGLLGAVPRDSGPPNQSRLSIFLDVRYPNLEAVLFAAAKLAGMEIDLFVKGATPAMKNFLSRRPKITMRDRFDDALLEVPNASAIVHHGAPILAALGVTAGRQHLVLPWTTGQEAVLEMLKRLGVAWWKDATSSSEDIFGTLRSVVSDQSILDQARQHQAKLADEGLDNALLTISAAVEAVSDRSKSSAGSVVGELPKQAAGAATSSKANAVAPEAKSNSFCALPFQHLCVGTEGTARVCCMARGSVTEDGVPMSLYRHTLDEIWNSSYMRKIRRAMAEGKPLKECEPCYANEAATGQSYRTLTGIKPLDRQPLDQASAVSAGSQNDYRIDRPPAFIKFELGNLCNLKCRMCCGSLSSEIERDRVHTQWNGGDEPLHAVWQGDVANIGPDFRVGIARSGIYDAEVHQGQRYTWTNGHARFDVPIGARRISVLEVEFITSLALGRPYKISANGTTVATGTIDPSNPTIRVDVSNVAIEKSIIIEIESDTIESGDDPHSRGLPVVQVRLHRKKRTDNKPDNKFEVIDLKLESPGLWYEDDQLVLRDMLGSRSGIQRLFFTGGEPLIEPRFLKIVDFLIEQGRAGDIDIEIVTNATRLNEKIVAKLLRFRSLSLCLSLDATGKAYDYLRYPARWESVERKVRQLTTLVPASAITATPVVQIYNALDITEVCRFCADLGINFAASFLQEPERLMVENLPENARRIAAERLHSFGSSDCRPQDRDHVLSMANYLETIATEPSPERLREFMLFTNDLDRSRGQSMRDSLPELYELLAESGFHWTDETRYADRGFKRGSAEDRVHAWI